MRLTYKKASAISGVQLAFFILLLFILEIKESRSIRFVKDASYMDLWILLNLILLIFEQIYQSCFAVYISPSNKLRLEISTYIIKSTIYLFAYAGAKYY